MIKETTAEGEVSYTHDAASRRATMQALGQTQVVYGFDDANRLATITQGTQTVTLGYDIADRRTTLVLPNNINLTYAYNNASELTGITYKRGTTTLGTLTYAYDAAGQRITMDGTG